MVAVVEEDCRRRGWSGRAAGIRRGGSGEVEAPGHGGGVGGVDEGVVEDGGLRDEGANREVPFAGDHRFWGELSVECCGGEGAGRKVESGNWEKLKGGKRKAESGKRKC